MHPDFLCPLGGGAITNHHHRSNDFIAMLSRVIERQLWLVKIRKGQHCETSVRVCWDIMSQVIRVEWPKANRTGTGSGSVPQLRPPFRL